MNAMQFDRMNRREFITPLGGAGAFAACGAHGRQRKI
jgi:hypothetical protein